MIRVLACLAAVLSLAFSGEGVLPRTTSSHWLGLKSGDWQRERLTQDGKTTEVKRVLKSSKEVLWNTTEGCAQGWEVVLEETEDGKTTERLLPVIPEDADVPERETELPRETIEVDGKTFDCEKIERKFEGPRVPGQKGSTPTWRLETTWKSADFEHDGGVLKVESRLVGLNGQVFRALSGRKVVKLSEKLKVGDREIDCHVVELTGDIDARPQVHPETQWRSKDVPGGVVKWVRRKILQDLPTDSTWELLDFGSK